jgi:hypothetical protein
MNDKEATQIMASAMDARGISYTPSEQEAGYLGRPYVAPAPLPAPAPIKTPEPQTVEQPLVQINAPQVGSIDDPVMSQAMAPPAEASAYQLPPPGPDTIPSPEYDAFRADAQNALHSLGLPQSIGRELALRADKASLQLPAPPAVIEQQRQTAMAQLTRTWGAEAPARIQAVQAEVNRVLAKHPGMRDHVERVGNDTWVVQQIWNTLQSRNQGANR